MIMSELQEAVGCDNESYSSAQSSYFSAQARSSSPACIVSPTTGAEVALILKVLVERKVKFALRGGGHTLNPGAANIEGGVTISLRGLKGVKLKEDEALVSIGGGAKWSEVYPVLNGLGIATSDGRVADVGVGGSTTGGGLSFFSSREGLVCDNVENYEVVLADGSVLNANKSNNQDLWQALKGGSNNFAIVTPFDIRTFPQENFYGGRIIYDISTLDEQLNGFAKLLENFDMYAAIMMSISWDQKRNLYSIFNNLEFTKNDNALVSLKPFLDAKPQYMNPMRISNLTDFAAETGRFAPSGLSWQSVEDDDKVTAAAKKLIADIDEAGKEKGVGSNFRYPKYAAGWQNPIKGYGGKAGNFERG
ncbi:hypothetical protein EYC84_002092 [Monilinia fructicola]|uniref:FAD-binding PCMH-type domain-containing protein n=1 Tax=Monilinia fructicola TaxID=38448 RepID=A0A5M9JSE6_MONFR|nr:hypothetical protein EYC84_002092 [Monilinia fructicola]